MQVRYNSVKYLTSGKSLVSLRLVSGKPEKECPGDPEIGIPQIRRTTIGQTPVHAIE